MKNVKLAIVASLVIGSSVMPFTAMAQHRVKHRHLKAFAAGVAGYEVAKHSHNRFLKKHRFAAGIATGLAANHYMKKHHH